MWLRACVCELVFQKTGRGEWSDVGGFPDWPVRMDEYQKTNPH